MEIVERIRANPLGYLCAAVIAVSVFLGGIWSAISEKTIVQLLAEGGWIAVTIRAAIWLVLFLFVSTIVIQIPWLRRLRNNTKSTSQMSLFIVAVVGAAISVAIWLWLVPGAPDKRSKARRPQPAGNTVTQRRHSERLTPLQIHVKINNADPLQKESIASALQNGTVEWTLRLFAVKSVRGAPDKKK